mgnify:CR=1 FL=1
MARAAAAKGVDAKAYTVDQLKSGELAMSCMDPVSYTHLKLPTSDLV